jgi:YgiT-type zinc finger domain-containing protein
MRCISCGAATLPGVTTDTIYLGNCLVIVRNVPCCKCTECNEVIYTGDVVKCLEAIAKAAGQVMSEITIVDYRSQAA